MCEASAAPEHMARPSPFALAWEPRAVGGNNVCVPSARNMSVVRSCREKFDKCAGVRGLNVRGSEGSTSLSVEMKGG